MFDFSIFLTPEAWISLLTLMFLEIVLGIDNLVFITITTDRLPENKQHIGRKLGLLGALVSRIIFLSFASYLVHMTYPVFTLDWLGAPKGFSIRDIVLILGGIYLLYKGVSEIKSVLSLEEEKSAEPSEHKSSRTIGLAQAIATIMVMDVVFSIDSVITAVGLANHLIIMIIAVMIAVFLMMAFIDAFSDFVNRHTDIKILALVFIVAIGALLVLDGMGFHTGIELMGISLEKLMVYFAMVFTIVLEVIQMRYAHNLLAWHTAQKKLSLSVKIEGSRTEGASVDHTEGSSAGDSHEEKSRVDGSAKEFDAETSRVNANISDSSTPR